MDIKAIDLYLQKLKQGLKDQHNIDDADIADYLEEVRLKDENKFFEYLNSLPLSLRAQTFIELPTAFQVDLILKWDENSLANIVQELESDDATDLFLAVSKVDKKKEEKLFSLLSDKKQKTIEKLISYDNNEAGSLMQTELFKVSDTRTIAYAIEKLSKLKENGIGRVQNIFITNEKGIFIKSISIDDLLLEKKEQSFQNILEKFNDDYFVSSHDDIDKVVTTIEKYDLVSLAVVDRMGHLIGRITHDDIVDIMQERATKQLYNLNRLDENEEIQEQFSKTTKTRATWLTINLINAVLASVVIGIFEETLDAIVALAVLMPIVANMAGTASVQTMTVIVRQMSLGEITFHNLKPILKKEINISLLNGILFGILSFAVTQVWFGEILISISIGLSMFVSFVSAGILGTTVPLVLKKINIDPAIASSVIVITIVDIIGFFSFLWFAELIILQ